MNAPAQLPRQLRKSAAYPLAEQLRAHVDGEVLFDSFSRGRYATDASIYQLEPVGIVVPKNEDAARAAIQIAAEQGVPVLPRGAGTSQCGQTVGVALVIDCSKYLNNVIEVDIPVETVTVQPGVVLDHLNALLRPHGWWFPVDVSTSAQATIGGMAGNNSCGARSIRYGNMVHNVAAIDALLADGSRLRLGQVGDIDQAPAYRNLVNRVEATVKREADEIAVRWRVTTPEGSELGSISQASFVPAGALDGSWGTTSLAVAQGGAEGVIQILSEFGAPVSEPE